MDRWFSLCDSTLARLGAAPLGAAPSGLTHFRALFAPTFTPAILIDAQLPARRARLLVSRRLPLAEYDTIRHNIRANLLLPADLALPDPAESVALRHQFPEPNMRDGVLFMGHVIADGRRSRFVARDLSEEGHRRYFLAMREIAVRFLGSDDPALRSLMGRLW